MIIKKYNQGFSLVEIILAIALFGLFATALIGLLMISYGSNYQAEEKSKAVLLAQEGLDAALSIRRQAWNLLVNGTYGLDNSGGYWQFSGSPELIDGQFTRTITIADGCRDVLENIVDCGDVGAVVDLNTKKITSLVAYTSINAVSNSVELVSYATNWQSANWTQTDWVGGDNQAIWSDPTAYDSDDGNIDVSASGQVSLAIVGTGGGCGDFDWTFANAGDYTFIPADIEVTSGVAQLVSSGGPITSGGTVNPNFSTNTSSWAYSDWTSENTSNVADGSWQGTGGNPGGYASIIIPKSKNIRSGGYWQQAFTTTVNNPTATLSFDWSALQYQSGSTDFGYYVYVDSFPGDPVYSFDGTNEVSRQEGISSLVGWTSVTNIDISSRVATPGTYYLKIAGWVDIPNGPTRGPYEIGFDNVQLSWSSAGSGSYPTTQPSINPTDPHSVSNISVWSSFNETATKNGGEIYYQISDDGISWYYWTGTDWNLASACDGTTQNCNIASDINLAIQSFPTSTAEISFRAFFDSNGSQQIELDNVQVSCAQNYDWNFNIDTEYTYNISEIEVTSGVAQLFGGGSSCSGTPNACNTLGSQVTCEAQGGCSWTTGSGSCGPVGGGACSAEPRNSCNTCSTAGCSRSGPNCVGTLNCSAFNSQLACTACGQCTWTGSSSSCSGTPNACNTFGNQIACEAQGGCSWAGGSYPISSAINPVDSLTVATIDAWSSFTETATKNGGEIYYQLSDNDGSTWQYWNGVAWSNVAGATDYSTAATVNANISDFSTTTTKIMFKAFLTGNGTQQVILDNVQIGWGEAGGGSGYATAGYLVSSAFNTTASSSFNTIFWNQTIPACTPACTIQLQVRSAPDASGSPGTWSNWYGATGSGTYFTNNAEQLLPAALNFNQWLQYRVELTGDGNDTPIFEDININYTP